MRYGRWSERKIFPCCSARSDRRSNFAATRALPLNPAVPLIFCRCSLGRARLDKRAAAHGRDSFVQRRENAVLAEDVGDAVPVHVGLEVGTDAREDDAHLLAIEIVEQFANGA